MDGKMALVGKEPIDTTGWFDNPSFELMVTEQLRYIFTEEPPILYFKFQYEHADDPVMINVDLPLASSDIQMVSFACSLEEAVDDVIFYFQHRDTGKVSDDKGRKVCGGIATRLHELANKLENAMG
jgi:hypothetical protein